MDTSCGFTAMIAKLLGAEFCADPIDCPHGEGMLAPAPKPRVRRLVHAVTLFDGIIVGEAHGRNKQKVCGHSGLGSYENANS